MNGDEMIVDPAEVIEPESGELIEHRAFFRDRIGQNDVEGRDSVGREEEQGISEVEDFPDFAAAELFDSRKIDHRLRHDLHVITMPICSCRASAPLAV